jgi:Tol biopolymer transport system component
MKKILLSLLVILSVVSISLYIVLDFDPQNLENRLSLPGDVIVQGKTLSNKDVGLYKYNRFTNTFSRLTSRSYLPFNPTLSPDKKKIAFIYVGSTGMNYRLAILDVKLGTIEILTENKVGDLRLNERSSIAWSPKGDTLLISGYSMNFCQRLVEYDLRTKEIKSITTEFCKNREGLIVESLNLSWSPGSEPVVGAVYSTDYGSFTTFDDIYLFNSALLESDWIGHGSYPVWSEDGKRITYICRNSLNIFNSLCEYSLEEKEEKVIIEKYGYERYAWIPGQTAILLITTGGESTNSYFTKINVATGEMTHLRKLWTFNDCLFCPKWISGQVICLGEK